jgi:hypothetical protein
MSIAKLSVTALAVALLVMASSVSSYSQPLATHATVSSVSNRASLQGGPGCNSIWCAIKKF